MYLVIVESPTKAHTIEEFIGSNYKVLPSYGHVRDLPKSELGVDIENNFKPKYIIPLKARKKVNELKRQVPGAEKIILATDEDREGEAIAWHLAQVLSLDEKKPYQRIVFHEITRPAIEEALKNPRNIDMNLVNAQQARRILDRIVGYKLSPFLWKKVAKGLSAGRVQSVAVRLVVEREREIQNFKPEEYWTIAADLLKTKNSKIKDSKSNQFTAFLFKKDENIIPKLGIKNKAEAEKIVKDLESSEFKISDIRKQEIKKNPLPPFITSTLQQEAWQKFHWPAKMTMQIAQQLYEKGLTTYHRTDSLNLSDLAIGAAKSFITENFGENYYQFRKFKTKSKLAQEAHEAIRPSYPEKNPEILKKESKLEKNQFKLYDLIWRRFIASQMTQASFDSTTVEIKAEIKNQKSNPKNYFLKTTGQILKFDGFLKVYPMKFEETELPPLELEEQLELIKAIPTQHFTQPPARYTEATLIKELEKNGIGRPSTYAPILSTIQERNYVLKNKARRFYPTEIGILVNDLLVKHFSEVVDIGFTAKMEEELDEIANGKIDWVSVLRNFYIPFSQNLEKKYQEIKDKKDEVVVTEKKCPKCGGQLVIRLSKYGKFLACSNFPKCRYTESLRNDSSEKAS